MSEPDTTQRDELRDRIYKAVESRWWCSPSMMTDAVLAELSEVQRMQAEGFLVEQRARQRAEAERDLQRQETETEHARAEAAEAKLAAVRELHQPEDWRSEVLDCVVPGCSACGSGDYPCPTIRTLDGDGDE